MALIASLIAALIAALVIVVTWGGRADPIHPGRKSMSGYQPTRKAESGKVLPPPKNR